MIGGSYQLIVQLIQLAQTQAINQAQQKLAEIAEQNPEMINNLILIMKDQSQKLSTQMGAAAYLNSAISDGIFSITKEQTIGIIAIILKDKDINPKHKRLLERSIISILDSTQDPLLTQFRELVYILMQQPILRDAGYLVIACFSIPESMDIQHVIYLTRMYFQSSLDSIILPNSQQTFYLASQINEILKTWVVVWDRLYKQYESYQKILKQSDKKKTAKNLSLNLEPIKIMEEFTQLQSISSLILNLYRWMAQEPTFICTHTDLHQLNILKEQAANLHYRILKVCYKKQSESIIVTMTGQIMQKIIENFLMITGNRKALDQYTCREFFVSLAKVIKQFICCKPKWFESCWKELLTKVIFPLMKPQEDQLISFEQNPNEFCSLFEDCTQKQTYQIIKTQMCKLIQVLSDKSEYITQKQFIPDFLVNFSVDSIKSYYGINTQNVYDSDFLNLDTSIIIMCILSYRISNHKDKINELRHVFSSENAYKSKAYDRSLLYLFLAYNYGDLYPNPEEGSAWVHLALSQNQHVTTTHCANDMLFNIADEYYSDYFVQQISNKILANNSPYIFDSIQKIIKSQSQNISQALMVEIIEKVYQRLSNQISMINLETKQTITILKLIQILKILVDKDDYCKENLAVGQMIWKIMEIFEKALQMDFEDQIFYILEGLLRQQNQISSRSKKMLPFILKQFAQDEYYEPFYYRIINLFIIKSTPEIIPYILKSLQTGVIFHSMKMGESMKKSERRLINSHLLILIQNALAVHGRTLNPDQIIQISAIVIRYLPMEDEKIDCNVVLARALNCLLMCHIVVRAEGTWEYVYKYHSKQIYYNYDIRVLLSCIKVCIVAQENPVVSAQMLAIGANVIQLFRKRQKLDKKSQQIKQKFGKDNRLKFVKYKQFQQILKQMKTPFQSDVKLQDEYSQLISNLKKTNLSALNAIFSQIPKEQQQTIIEMTKMKDLSENDPAKRHKFTVLRVKAPQNVKDYDEDQHNKETPLQIKLDDEQQEEGQYKRKRVQNKKKRKDKEMKE